MVRVYTPKQRMLNAYKGIFSDRRPVAPEFWYYYPAKVIGVNMVEFEREIPFWQALQTTFKKYGTEGWGAAFPSVNNSDIKKISRFKRISDSQYKDTTEILFKGKKFTAGKIYDINEPSWNVLHMANDAETLGYCVDMALSDENMLDFSSVNEAHRKVGEDYLLEMWLGVPFFDFIAEMMGFENAVLYFTNEQETVLKGYQERYIDYQKRFIRSAFKNTSFESFVIGCSYSCNSLIGPRMWRKWDKPYIKEMADEIHRNGRFLHIHFHGRAMETASDFSEIGIDCVCPFERPPGGDVDGMEGLKNLRMLLADKVTMNGNVHTVETLIRGSEDDVKREVREIKEAFKGSARLIIGTGDQVGRETPEENIIAMVEEAKNK